MQTTMKKKRSKELLSFLFMEVFFAIFAVIIFKTIQIKWQAAIVAGLGFVILGAWMVLKTLRWEGRFKYFSFYFCRLFLWLFALPLFLIRLRFLSQDFQNVRFFSLTGPEFHKWSEVFYLILILGTIMDFFIEKKRNSEHPSVA